MSVMKAGSHRAHCMRGSSSRFSSAFIVPSWQLLIRFKQTRHCLLSLLASFRGAEEIVSVTEPLPGQILRGLLVSIVLCWPLVALTPSASAGPQDTCDRYPVTWAAHLQSCSSAPGSNNAASLVCSPSSSQHTHPQLHLESHLHHLLSLQMLSLPSRYFLLPGLTTRASDIVRSIHLIQRASLTAVFSDLRTLASDM